MIHFYFGENDFALRRQIDAVVDKFASKYGAENISRLDAAEIDPQKLLAEIVNINLFAPNRLIVVVGLGSNKAAWVVLGENLARVPDETELIIVVPKPDRRTKTFKQLDSVAKSREFKLLIGQQIDEFVMHEAANQGVEIERDAVRELIVYTGGDQWRIASEIAKFRALDRLVTVELVHEYVEPELAANAFKILEDILDKRHDSAMAELARLRQIEDPNRFFGLLASQVYVLAAVVNADDRGANEIASDTKAHPFLVNKMRTIARQVTARDIARISQIVAETDAKMKSTGADPWRLVELALAKIV